MTAPARVRPRIGPTVQMGGGLLVVGAAGYGFMALAGRTLSPPDAAAVSTLYLLINIIGPGVFVALEQETSRSISAHLVSTGETRAVRRRAAAVGLGLLGLVVFALVAISPLLVRTALGGREALFIALVLGSVTNALVYLVRGLLGGRRRFAGYAVTLAAEGLARLLPCLAVAAAGTPDAAAYALLFAVGSGFGAIAGLPWLRRAGPGDPADGVSAVEQTLTGADGVIAGSTAAGMARAMAILVGSTLLAQLVANLAPVVVSARLVTDKATAAAFASAFVLVRIPVLVFAPVQSMLLPSLTAAATRKDMAEVRRTLRPIMAAVAVVGILGVLVSMTLGPWAVQVFFGAHVRLSGLLLGALGIGTLGHVIAMVLQPSLVALGRHASATASWLLGSAVLIGLLALPGDPLRAAVIAQLAGCAFVVAGMGASLSAALRKGPE